MTLQQAYAKYKENKLTQLNRQQFTVLEACEHFLDSNLALDSMDIHRAERALEDLWLIASRT